MSHESEPIDLTRLEKELRQAVRGEVSFDAMTRGLHATDASHYQIMPTCVVVPMDADDAASAVHIAAKFHLPITPRGGGTSLSGQTHGTGMVIDCSKYMDKVLHIDAEARTARVQPGVVRDRLNERLKPMGLQFSPDPATGNRATVGGMIGNNASGTRSIVYGKTSDKVIACKVALADGTVVELGPCDSNQWSDKSAGGSREAELYRGVGEVVRQHHDAIERKFPKVMRRVSGYNLDAFLVDPDARPWNLATLIAGSEGTLGVLLEVTIRLDELPKATALCVAHFDDRIRSLEAVSAMLEHGPSAVEMLDASVLDEARVNRATRDLADFIEGAPRAVQIVEFFGDTPDEAAAKAHRLAEDLKARGLGYAWPVASVRTGQA